METRNSKLPVNCPSCGDGLVVKSLHCKSCETTISGFYDIPKILRLDEEELTFIYTFVINSGSLKEMAKEMNLSYPSVRNYLNSLIEKLKQMEDESH